LSGSIAAAFTSGLQQGGVGSIVYPLLGEQQVLGEEQEFSDDVVDVIVPERALREIHFYPFQIVQKVWRNQYP
jgi:beta-glucosidase-like glycosyl hydrolase